MRPKRMWLGAAKFLMVAALANAEPPIQQSSANKSDKPTKLPNLNSSSLGPRIEVGPDPNDKTTRFDPFSVQVRREGKSWQIWAGRKMIKDFGEQRNDAFEARRLIAELKLNEYGAIGTPKPVMEYWLVNGEAPPLPGLPRNVIGFDRKRIRLAEEENTFYIRDDRHVLFNFGPYGDDAREALAVIQKHDFNEVGFIGSPQPTMTFLLKNPNARSASNPNLAAGNPQFAPQQLPRHPLDLPGIGRVGERRPFDPLRLEIRRASDGWHLASGAVDLGAIGTNEYHARTAMQIAMRYPLDEFVTLGTSGFGFFLAHGAAPRGIPPGIRSTPFQPRSLEIKQAGTQFTVTDGRTAVATFSSMENASRALKVIQHYGFNCWCLAGQGLKYLAVDR